MRSMQEKGRMAAGLAIGLALALGSAVRAADAPAQDSEMNHSDAKPVLTDPGAFDASDRNADGVVDWEEYRNAVTKIFFEADTDADGVLSGDELAIIRPHRMASVDTNKDGKVQQGEFTSASILVFRTGDSNGDGKLTREEVAEYVKKTGGDK